MSKPTLQERATLFMEQETGSTAMRGSADIDRLVLFAAQEVARVREMQGPALTELRDWFGHGCEDNPGGLCPQCKALMTLWNATRPEKPARVKAPAPYRPRHKPGPGLPRLDDVLKARGLTHVGFVEKGGVVTDVNHKPVKRCACDAVARLLCNNAPKKWTCRCLCHRGVKQASGLSTLAKAAKKGKR